MLHLYKPTNAGWYDRVSDHLPLLMADHAHLEKRAASTALSMIFRYTSRRELIFELSQVVREEMAHFVEVLKLMEEREFEFRKVVPSPYASLLTQNLRRNEPFSFLDKLLAAGFIGARSSERFQILGARVEDIDLANFYSQLAIQEASHYALYERLARTYFRAKDVKKRMKEIAEFEWDALEASAGEPRIHSF